MCGVLSAILPRRSRGYATASVHKKGRPAPRLAERQAQKSPLVAGYRGEMIPFSNKAL